MQITEMDLETVELLNNAPCTRDVRVNIAHHLHPDDDPDNVQKINNRLNNRLNRLAEVGIIRRVGPAARSGLYELTDKGREAAEIINEHGVETEEEVMQTRLELVQRELFS